MGTLFSESICVYVSGGNDSDDCGDKMHLGTATPLLEERFNPGKLGHDLFRGGYLFRAGWIPDTTHVRWTSLRCMKHVSQVVDKRVRWQHELPLKEDRFGIRRISSARNRIFFVI